MEVIFLRVKRAIFGIKFLNLGERYYYDEEDNKIRTRKF
jgi:hypothetical protein